MRIGNILFKIEHAGLSCSKPWEHETNYIAV
jgi:hypothetical protein